MAPTTTGKSLKRRLREDSSSSSSNSSSNKRSRRTNNDGNNRIITLEEYHDSSKPYSYASRKRVHAAFPPPPPHHGGGGAVKKHKGQIDQTLHMSEVYTKFRQYKRPRQYLPVYVHERREQFQMDIIYMTGRPARNKGYKFVLSVIDCYTKFAWCFPLQRISGKAVVTSLRQLFSNPDNIPRKVHTDRGVEFKAKIVQEFMKSMKILHTFSYSVRKACIAERFNQTIEGLVARELAGRRIPDDKWLSVLKRCLVKYNYVNKHSTIKMTPAEAELVKNQAALKKTYDAKYSKIKRKPAKFKVGNYVRLFVNKGKFGRSYQQDFTNEVFIVDKVFTNMPRARYQLKDLAGIEILGNAIDEELVLYIPPAPAAAAADAADADAQQQQQQALYSRRDKFLHAEL